MSNPTTLTLSLADERDRARIYAIRHQVYAGELKQHPENSAGLLVDRLDEVNVYLVAKRADQIAGFVSITPPTHLGYSIDKYFPRSDLPLLFDARLFEVRLLTVTAARRGSSVAPLLMHAGLRYAEACGARTPVANGTLEALPMHRRARLE